MDGYCRGKHHVLVALVMTGTLLGAIGTSHAQVTATWIGGSGNGYNTPANWDINLVPINDGGDTYNVVIPGGFSVVFDVDAASSITDFTLAASSTLTVPGGHSLTVLDDALISGLVTADSTDALFDATAAGAAFGPGGGRATATNSGTVRIAATSFTNSATGGNATQFSADGDGSLLDLSSLLTYAETINSGGLTRTVSATNKGVIDLSNVGTITKTSNGTVRFLAESGGQILFGNFNVTGNVQFRVDGSESDIHIAGSANLSAPSSIALTDAARLNVGGDLLFDYVNEAAWNLDAGIMNFHGPGQHFLEVAGEDLGANGASSGNFGIGQLVVGSESEAIVVTLVDVIDNGNRTNGPEALYLYGLGGPDGLRVLGGSTLVIGNLNAYAFLNGAMVQLNGLFPQDVTTIPFDEGFLAIPEPNSLVLAAIGALGAFIVRNRSR